MSDLPSPSPSALTYPEATPSLDPNERPTWVRYRVLAFLAAMTFILYLDRSCINQAAPIIQREMGISETQKAIIFNAFALAYAIFEIPAGRWGDRYGSRRILTRIVLWWSFFTALTGAAWGFGSLIVIRFLFGAGEAGALPNSARVLRSWFPESSRGRAQGIVTTAMLLGGAASYTTSQWLIDRVEWRWSFAIFALLGVGWALAFYLWFRDDPAEHAETNDAERRLITAGPAPHRSVEASEEIGVADLAVAKHDVHGPIPWDRVAGCAEYLVSGRDHDHDVGGVGIGERLVSDLFAGSSGRISGPVGPPDQLGAPPRCDRRLFWWVVDRLARAEDRKSAVGPHGSGSRRCGTVRLRHLGQYLDGLDVRCRGFHRAGLLRSTAPASILVGLCHPGQRPAPRGIFGLMNMMGGLGRIVSQLFVGGFADWRKSLGYTGRAQWDPSFYLYVAIALFGMIFWRLVNPEKTVDNQEKKTANLD